MKLINSSQKEKPLLSVEIIADHKILMVMGDVAWSEIIKLTEKGTQLEFSF